jgi:hypothetical protein
MIPTIKNNVFFIIVSPFYIHNFLVRFKKYFLLTKAGNLNDCFVGSFLGWGNLLPSFVVALTRMDYIFHLAFCFFVNDWVDCQSAVARRFCFLGVIAGSCITSKGCKPTLGNIRLGENVVISFVNVKKYQCVRTAFLFLITDDC